MTNLLAMLYFKHIVLHDCVMLHGIAELELI